MPDDDREYSSDPSSREIRLPDQARSFRVRADLTDAAVREVADSGYGAATVTAIADRAGVPTDAFYAQFASKDAALVHAYDVAVAFAVPRILRAIRSADDWREAVVAGLSTYLTILDCDREWALVCLGETASASEHVREAREALRAPIVEALECLPVDPESTSVELGAVLAGLDAIAIDGLRHRPEEPLTSRHGELVRFVLAPFSEGDVPDEIEPPAPRTTRDDDRVEALLDQGGDGALALELLVRAAVGRRDGPTLWRVIVGLERRRAAGHDVPLRLRAEALEGIRDAWFFGLPVGRRDEGDDGA